MTPSSAARKGTASAAAQAMSPGRSDRRLSLLWLLLALVTAGAWELCFAPFDMAALAYVVLVPWGLIVILPSTNRTAIGWGWVTGVLTMALGLYWLTWITLLGYALVTFYMSVYWLMGAWVIRRAAVRRWPLWIMLPVVWMGLEYFRSVFASGFPWFMLAHTQYRMTMLIQIADITGPYGVSFFVAMVNGVILDLLVNRDVFAAPRPGCATSLSWCEESPRAFALPWWSQRRCWVTAGSDCGRRPRSPVRGRASAWCRAIFPSACFTARPATG